MELSRAAERRALVAGWTAIGALTALYTAWLRLSHPTIVALSLLLVVLIVAAWSTLRVAVAASLLAFICFNFFFLPPVGTLRIADPENWVALFTLLAVSIIGSHLSSQARRRAQKALSADLKSALLASLSHDLKTPLTAATIAANNATASWLGEEQRREQLDIVLAELQRLNRLFHNIVEMAAIESDAVTVEREWVQASEIVDAAARQVEGLLAAHPLAVDLGAERLLVRVDPQLTTTALAHLLENATQYSAAGEPIAVRIITAADELRIAVRDRGPGVSAADAARIFEWSVRGADAARHRFGTGLGLAITRGLLAAEGGRVFVENHPDGGAVFTIVVPADTQPASAVNGAGV